MERGLWRQSQRASSNRNFYARLALTSFGGRFIMFQARAKTRTVIRTCRVSVLVGVVCAVVSASDAAAYTWDPINTSVRGETAGPAFIFYHSGEEVHCRSPITGRTGSYGSSSLTLTFAPSECRASEGGSVPLRYSSPTATLTAIRLSQSSGHGEGTVFSNGVYTLELRWFGMTMCTVAMSGNGYPTRNEEFALYESQVSGSNIYISKEFPSWVASGSYPNFCAGPWYLHIITGERYLSPYNLRITW